MGGANSLVGGASGCHDSLVVISGVMRRARGSFLVGRAPGCRSDVVVFSLTLNQRSSVMSQYPMSKLVWTFSRFMLSPSLNMER